MISLKNNLSLISIGLLLVSAGQLVAQPVYFADGQHGGVYGHYPPYVTQYLVDELNQHPGWKINLEIEPETWDVVQTNTPAAYDAFKKLFADQSVDGRLEYVNPEYGQSYLWNVTGESMIRQFDYGIRKVRQHFPNATFTAYASEEPMFTSALPGILESFGFKYAVLKNPDTCWGGYTRAFGGELVNWLGPDGTGIPTVPRYAVEALQPGSTWQTIAWGNSPPYINAALQAGIEHPIGMCFQDAGWKNGPWLGDNNDSTHPLRYETWRHYFEKVAVKTPDTNWANWSFSQEDVLVSLVWGSPVLQKIAQEVRMAENRIVAAEKLTALAKIDADVAWPQASFDEAWRTLLLAEHHDCWIVPYNLKNGRTWAEHVATWTGATCQTSEAAAQKAVVSLSPPFAKPDQAGVRVFNTLGVARTALTSVRLPRDWEDAETVVLDQQDREIPSQRVLGLDSNAKEVLFSAEVPALGYATYHLKKSSPASTTGASVALQADGTYKLETDLYAVRLNPAKGGVIASLVAKKSGREFVDTANVRRFDEIRGYFYNDGGFHSSADQPAAISILESGPVRVRVAVKGTIDHQPFEKIITLAQGQRVVDFDLRIDWQGNPGIGSEYGQAAPWDAKDNVKAFYDDRYKLSVLFPLNLESQTVYKNAPFDVTESKLTNTFFTRWDGIKNNIILNWVDVLDASNHYGLALLTDHTTSYQHGADAPLGLTLQYSGVGLWGQGYHITGPMEVRYALVPHAGKWDDAGIWTESDGWNQPLMATVMNAGAGPGGDRQSLLDATGTGFELPAVFFKDNDLIARIFNAEGGAQPRELSFHFKASKVQLVELDGRVIRDLPVRESVAGTRVITLALPRYGVRTLKFCEAHD